MLLIQSFHLSVRYAVAAKLQKLIMNNEIHTKYPENLQEVVNHTEMLAANCKAGQPGKQTREAGRQPGRLVGRLAGR